MNDKQRVEVRMLLGISEAMSDEGLIEELDMLVHDVASGKATIVNNSGVQAQLNYIND